MVASNVSMFDKVANKDNTSDYLVALNKYDPAKLPLELKPIRINKPGAEPVLFVKPIMKKPDGSGDYQDLIIMTRPSRILFDIVPWDDKAKKYVKLSNDEMVKVYDAVPPGGSKSFDLCLEPQADVIAFCKSVDELVKKFVLGNVDKFPDLVRARDRGANLLFYPTVVSRKALNEGDVASEHLKTKLFFRDGDFDLKAFDAADKLETSIRDNRLRLPRGKVNAMLRFGNIWTNVMGSYGSSWKVLGGHFEFAANQQKPATCDDLFRAFSDTMGEPLPASASSASVTKAAAAAKSVVVHDDDDDFDDDDAAVVAAAPGPTVVVVDDEEEEEEEEEDDGDAEDVIPVADDDEDEEEDDGDDEEEEEDDAEAQRLAEEIKRKEAEAAEAAKTAEAAKAAEAAKKAAVKAKKAAAAPAPAPAPAPAEPVAEPVKAKAVKAKGKGKGE